MYISSLLVTVYKWLKLYPYIIQVKVIICGEISNELRGCGLNCSSNKSAELSSAVRIASSALLH